jgi:hypothetical protein
MNNKIKQKSFPTPRSWAYCSKLISERENSNQISRLISSSVGDGTSAEFIGFLKLQTKIDFKSILSNPKQVEKIKEIDLKYVLIGTLSEKYKTDKKLFEKIIPICDYLNAEFSILLLRFLKGANPKNFNTSITNSKKGIELLTKYAEILV